MAVTSEQTLDRSSRCMSPRRCRDALSGYLVLRVRLVFYRSHCVVERHYVRIGPFRKYFESFMSISDLSGQL
jgi:hypothetical protein